eukprot:jgi/Picsp_1/4370/NSC_01876-R1_hypothetical protein CHLNCDRAFT_138367 [Chlorella variabilis]
MEIDEKKWSKYGITAIAASNAKLLVVHLVCELLFATTVASLSTSWFFTFDYACMLRQSSFIGCQSCPCAIDNSCTENDGRSPGCEACEILSATACSTMRGSTSSVFIATAVTGFAILLASYLPICIEIVVLHHKLRQYIISCSNVYAIRTFVEQQSRLVAAGDKPTCTPGTLAKWVAELNRSGNKPCQESAGKCRYILQQRGFDLNSYLGSRLSATEKRLSSNVWIPHLSDDSIAQTSAHGRKEDVNQRQMYRDSTRICKHDLEDQC